MVCKYDKIRLHRAVGDITQHSAYINISTGAVENLKPHTNPFSSPLSCCLHLPTSCLFGPGVCPLGKCVCRRPPPLGVGDCCWLDWCVPVALCPSRLTVLRSRRFIRVTSLSPRTTVTPYSTPRSSEMIWADRKIQQNKIQKRSRY